MKDNGGSFACCVIQINDHAASAILHQNICHAHEEIELDRRLTDGGKQTGDVLVGFRLGAGIGRVFTGSLHFILVVEGEHILGDAGEAPVRKAVREAEAVAQIVGRISDGRHAEGHIVDCQQRLQNSPAPSGSVTATALQKRIRAEVIGQAVIRRHIDIHGFLQRQVDAGKAGIPCRVIREGCAGKAMLRIQRVHGHLCVLAEDQSAGSVDGSKAAHRLRKP